MLNSLPSVTLSQAVHFCTDDNAENLGPESTVWPADSEATSV